VEKNFVAATSLAMPCTPHATHQALPKISTEVKVDVEKRTKNKSTPILPFYVADLTSYPCFDRHIVYLLPLASALPALHS
jgi:hypothetical protein